MQQTPHLLSSELGLEPLLSCLGAGSVSVYVYNLTLILRMPLLIFQSVKFTQYFCIACLDSAPSLLQVHLEKTQTGREGPPQTPVLPQLCGLLATFPGWGGVPGAACSLLCP